MIQILFSWIIILISSLLFGYSAICLFYRKANCLFSLDVFILSGLMVATV